MLKIKINVTTNFAAIFRGHGKARPYFHHFKIMEEETCLCNKGDQTIDHLLYLYTLLHTARELLGNTVLKSGNGPANKQEITTKYLKVYLTFTNSLSPTALEPRVGLGLL